MTLSVKQSNNLKISVYTVVDVSPQLYNMNVLSRIYFMCQSWRVDVKKLIYFLAESDFCDFAL